MTTSNKQHKRIAIAIVLSTVCATAVLLAQGGTQLLAASLLPLDPGRGGGIDLGDVRPAPPERVDATPILRRNIFDHETGPLDQVNRPEPEEQPEEQPVEELDPNAPPPRCDGSMRLVGAFVRTRDPADSFAAITNASGEVLLYQAGMEVDDRELLSIQHNLVVLRPRSGTLCSLAMFDSGAPRVATAARPTQVAAAAPSPARSKRGTPEGLDPAELESGISRVSDGEFSIQRSLVDRLLQNQAAVMRMARVIPHEEGGRVVGVKLYGIRRSSLLGRLGIQNGDMLRTINGYDMSSPDSALEAYARLRSAERITLNLNRRGQDQTIDYQIR